MNFKDRSNYFLECDRLPNTPKTATEAYNKLVCLSKLEDTKRGTSHDLFRIKKMSKRQERIVKMYWAFRKMEAAQ